MIEIGTKIHDQYSIELKVGFVTRKQQRMNDFSLAMWMFVPRSLDITRTTYPKEMFYQDVKSNIRLITPTFLLREIVDGPAVPLLNIREAFGAMASSPTKANIGEYEYHIKMFASIVKSAMRDEILHIATNRIEPDANALCEGFIENAERILDEYGKLRSIINVPTVETGVMQMYLRGDEFLGDVAGKHLLDLIAWLESKDMKDLSRKASALYSKIGNHKKNMSYPELREDDPGQNRLYLHRFSVLKKYIESVLYLRAPKKRDGVLVEQIYLSIAAGIAMIVATGLSALFRKQFGSMALLLFIAMVVSYMLRDRIKDLARYYFAHKVGSKYFDNKAKIIHKDVELGWLKEGVDVLSLSKVPSDVLAVRNSSHLTELEDDMNPERVILYRKSVHIDRTKLQGNTDYDFLGINDILRLNVQNFTKKMDDPIVPMKTLSSDGVVSTVLCKREYYVNLVLQYSYDDVIEYKRFRIALSRDGIQSISEVGR